MGTPTPGSSLARHGADCQGKLNLTECFIPELPERLIGDKAYDSDPLAAQLSGCDVERIKPNRAHRKTKTQDGHPLRRYKRRWKIERLFAWLHNFRRLVTLWEHDVLIVLGFVQLGCIVILLRRCS